MRQAALAASADEEDGHSGEYGTLIIHSMETGQPRVVYGNVTNRGRSPTCPALLRRSSLPGRSQRRAANPASVPCRRSWRP